MFLQSLTLHAQSVVYTAMVEDDDSDIVCGLIRSWKGSKAVAYHIHNGERLFSIIDSASRTVHSARVPDIYIIKDFRIVGDTLYCGGSRHDTAMMAYFDINEIISGPNINYHVSMIDSLNMLNRLAAFRNDAKNGVGVAAIGTKTVFIAPYIMENTYMVWCDNYGGNPFSVSIRRCKIYWSTTPSSESLNDVVITEKYVAYVGIYTASSLVTIRKGDRNGPFSSTLIDTIHSYYFDAIGMESLPIAEALGPDTLAVGYTCEDLPDRHAVHIHFFDLSDMTMYNTHRLELPGRSKMHMREMVYMAKHKTLLVCTESGSGYEVIYTRPAAMGTYTYPILAISNSEEIFSMDHHNGDYYLLSTKAHWMLQRMGFPAIPGNCTTKGSGTASIWTISMDSPYGHYSGFFSYPFFPVVLHPMSFNTTVSCASLM